jgi:hypothetical protein
LRIEVSLRDDFNMSATRTPQLSTINYQLSILRADGIRPYEVLMMVRMGGWG